MKNKHSLRGRRRWLFGLAAGLITAMVVAGSAVAYIDGGWPETCLEMNDMVEASPRGSGAVGIYQNAFGADAEAACQRDHLVDVQTAFAWAMGRDAPAAPSVVIGEAIDPQSSRVLYVYDGDTITVEHRGVVQALRYHGVFAPELRDADGQRARLDNLALVPVGSQVTWHACYTVRSRPAEVKGRYQLQTTHDRIVARVTAGGVSVNDQMSATVYASGGAGASQTYPACVPG